MKPTTTNVHTELKKIAGMQALSLTRYYLLIATIISIIYFFSYNYSVYYMYVFLFALLAPFFMEQIPKNQTGTEKPLLFPVLKEEYQYTPLRYQCLLWTFWLSNLLLAVCVMKSSLSDTAFHYIPLFLLSSNILIYMLFFYYYQFKFHYQLINNRW